MTDGGGRNGAVGPVKQSIPSVLVVMGVSGSGKTTVGLLLANRLGWEYADADEFHPPENIAKMKSGQPLTDHDRWPWLRAVAQWIENKHTSKRHGIVACSGLKRRYREVLVGDLGDAVGFIYLEGSRELITERLSMRHNHFMPPSLLETQFEALEVPDPDEQEITVSIEADPIEIVRQVIERLELGAVARGAIGG